jgi:hypothetical protein
MKTKFIGKQNFKTSFGKSKSIPLRKDGAIRAFGPYSDDQNGLVGIKVGERTTLKVENIDKNISVHWKSY